MSIPVFYSQVTPNIPVTTAAQLASTAGSLITILDFVLVNGGNQLNINSITRTGTVAVIQTSAAHPYSNGDTVELANTGEANFNGKFKVHQILGADTLSVKVSDTGAASTGVAGTIKHAAAGWTKTVIGTNQAAYHSANFADGLPRTIQIEDNSPYSNTYDFRIRLAVGWTALNTATKISSARKYSKLSGNAKWAIVADNKTVQMFFGNLNNYYIGEAYGFDALDNNISILSAGTDGGVYGTQFGCQSTAPASQTLGQTAFTFLESAFTFGNDVFGSTSIGGTPSITALSLPTVQNSLRYSSPINGNYITSYVDLWEKLSDVGQTHFPRGRAKGILQPTGRLPIGIASDIASGIYFMRELKQDNTYKDLAIFNCSSTTQASSSHIAINLSEW